MGITMFAGAPQQLNTRSAWLCGLIFAAFSWLAVIAPAHAQAAPTAAQCATAWANVSQANTRFGFEEYLRYFSSCDEAREARERLAAMSGGVGRTRGLGQTRDVTPSVTPTPVLVEIGPGEVRRPANGGSAIVLLSAGGGSKSRNEALCAAVTELLSEAAYNDIRTGLRRNGEGELEALRPVYWPLKTDERTSPGSAQCDERIARYDFVRAQTIRSKLGISGRGPFLAVIRTDEGVANTVDFTRLDERNFHGMVTFFRDGFSQRSDVWAPGESGRAAYRGQISRLFGPEFRGVMMDAIVTVMPTTVNLGCRAGDLADARCS